MIRKAGRPAMFHIPRRRTIRSGNRLREHITGEQA